jgi:hypothetical protein
VKEARISTKLQLQPALRLPPRIIEPIMTLSGNDDRLLTDVFSS